MRQPILTTEQKERLVVLSGDAHAELGSAVANSMGVGLGGVELRWHPNTEPYVRLLESVRDKHVVAIQSHVASKGKSASDALIQHGEIISAARQSHGLKVMALAPYLFGSRQDRRSRPRESVTIKNSMLYLKSMGAYSLATVDLHTPQSLEIFDGPSDHLTAHLVLGRELSYVRTAPSEEIVLIAPDVGRSKLLRAYKEVLAHSGKSPSLVYLDKDRIDQRTGEVKHSGWLPDVEGKTCILIDDMIDRGSTAVSAAHVASSAGAHNIYLAATHGFFNYPAVDRIKESPISKVFVTDSMPTVYDAKKQLANQLRIVSIAPMLARAAIEMITGGSLAEYFEGQHYT